MLSISCNTLRYDIYPMVWEINYLFDLDFSRATKPFRILVDRKPLTEIVIVELKIKYMETLIKTNNTKNYNS